MRSLKLLAISVVLLCFTMGVLACSPSVAGPETGDPWARVQESGQLIVGTSADYPPFESYNENFRIDGFDIALIREIARTLGVGVEINDMAFEGLPDALAVDQIDVAIAAISITPEREENMTFSQVYYVSEDAIVAAEGADIPTITAVEDLAPYTIGVQQSSVFADWLGDELIDTDLMPATNLALYDEADHALRDLRDGRIDVVVLDLLPAEAAVDEGGLQLVGQGLNRERYGIAMKSGATDLRDAINGALNQLQEEGVIANLVDEYLQLDADDVLPTPSPTPEPAMPTPVPTNTAVPGETPAASATPVPPTPTPVPTGCTNSMDYVADLTYDDAGMAAPPVLQPGETFRKGWRVINNGTCTWNSGYTLSYVQGSSPLSVMSGLPVSVSGTVQPGQTYDFYVDLVAPTTPGTYQGIWQMRTDEGVPFGERVWVGVTVPGQPTPTPAPTQTPVPGISFSVDRTNIRSGDCVTFRWDVQNVREVYFYADGQNWQDRGVAGQASRQECPSQSTTYNLRVVKNDGSVETRQIRIDVEVSANAPKITEWAVSPSPILQAGQCVSIAWRVEGDIRTVKLTRNNDTLWNDAPFSGNTSDCPQGINTYVYNIEASGPGGSERSSVTVQVVQ